LRGDLKRLKREIESGRTPVRPVPAGNEAPPQPAAPVPGSSQTVPPPAPAMSNVGSVSSGTSAAAAPVTAPLAPGRRYWFAAIGLILVAVVAAVIWFWGLTSSGAQIESVAVLPFASSGTADTDLLSDGITQALIDSLALAEHGVAGLHL